MIIETSANQLYRVRETGNPDLAHVWFGIRVKLIKNSYYAPRAGAKEELVRKAASRIIDQIDRVPLHMVVAV